MDKKTLKNLTRLVGTAVRVQSVNDRGTDNNYIQGVLKYQPVRENNTIPRFSVDNLNFSVNNIVDAYDKQFDGVGLIYLNHSTHRGTA